MMLLNSTDTPLYRQLARQFPQYLGWLIGPRTFKRRRSLRENHALWAGDNDCFNGFNIDAFLMMLWNHRDVRKRCLFITSPDVVGNAKKTLFRFLLWAPVIRLMGYPVALVAQDGLENLPIPWFAFECLFVGGTTEWKLSQEAVSLVREAKQHGKWVHIGRVNSQKRIRFCYGAGADSFDGSGFGMEPDAKLKWALPLLRSLDLQQELPL